MKALSVLGTSSNSGKSWMATALCAWLRRQGIRVAPFKAQNMSNNAYVTLDGGEIGRAQAVQAEACGLVPTVEMNPILLKPSGGAGSQLILLGKAQGHHLASEYYTQVETLWKTVTNVLEEWKSKCDVLVMEGAGSPVELNLMDRDIVNLRPVRYLNGRWLLVGDIERGGVFAQLAGTWGLMPSADQQLGLGLIVNKFRGDPSLFSTASDYLKPLIPLPYLGVLPYRSDLQPESEDSLCQEAESGGTGDLMAWIRLPHISNSSDIQPWRMDHGVRCEWVNNPKQLAGARMIVIPGSKNTISDLYWLRKTGLAEAIVEAAHRGVCVIGICGGYQLLGRQLRDEAGIAGDAGTEAGIGLLPVETTFSLNKKVEQISLQFEGETWVGYEIHMGRTTPSLHSDHVKLDRFDPFETVSRTVMGTYCHGIFESARLRAALAKRAGMERHRPSEISWREQQENLYKAMADHLESNLNLDEVKRYVGA